MNIKIGQIYEDNQGRYVITKILDDWIDYIYNNGMVNRCHIKGFKESGDVFIAAYPDWRAAVQSHDFNRIDILA